MYPSEASPALGSYVKSQVGSLKKYVDIDLLIIQGRNGIFPYIRSIPLILRKIYFSKVDVIHIHYGNLGSFVKLLYWGMTPIVTSYCGTDLLGDFPKRNGIKNTFFMRLNILLSKYDDCSIVKSKVLAKKIRRSKRIEIVPNGVDTNQFCVLDKVDARKNLGLSDYKKTVILFPADPKLALKNFNLLADALASIDEKTFEILTFMGNKVSHDDIPFYFNAADIVAFTSLSEGSPNAIKEAMSCNCNIYSTDCGDVAWLLEGVRGSKVLSYNVSEWSVNLSDFFCNKNSVTSDSRANLLSKNLDIESIAKRIVNIYYSLIPK